MDTKEKEMRVQILHENTGMSVEDCIAQIDKISELYEKLKKGVVKFTFKKKDGTIRHATGTVVAESIDYEFKGRGPAPLSIVAYWDLEKNAFRSFSIASYIGMEE